MNEQFSAPMTPSQGGAKGTLREAKDKFKEGTQAVAAQARERGTQYFEQNRVRTAERMTRVCERMRETADRFEQDDDDADVARYTRLLAGKLDSAAAYVRQHDFQQLRHDAEDLARRHPAIFFGGLLIVGIAAGRFLKASADRTAALEAPGDDTEDISDAPLSASTTQTTQTP
jgi:hypothetical protein